METPDRATGTITGRICSPAGEPLADVVVMITGTSPVHPDIAALTDAAGTYRYDDLLPGEYEILINSERYGQATAQVQVEAGRATRLDITLPE